MLLGCRYSRTAARGQQEEMNIEPIFRVVLPREKTVPRQLLEIKSPANLFIVVGLRAAE